MPSQPSVAGVAASLLLAAIGNAAASEATFRGGERLGDTRLVRVSVDGAAVSGRLATPEGVRKADGLVRWGEPRPPARRPGLRTVDGSLLLSDREWSPRGLVTIEGDKVRLRRGAGWVEAPRASVATVWLGPSDAASHGAGSTSERDTVTLVGGDRLEGDVVALTDRVLVLRVAGEEITTPRFRVESIRFAAADELPTEPSTLVGFADGSVVHARRVAVRADAAAVELVGGGRVASEAGDVAFVQPLPREGLRYLSELTPVDYRHTPYLDLAWPFGRDAASRGGPLAGGGRRAAKGVALHSAARLVYRLDGSPQRFRADVAVADSPPGQPIGSAGCAVYLVRGGRFVPAWQSETIRGGEPAIAVDVDCADAGAVALVVDYADGGDAGDDALWLDARLERP